MNYRIKWLVGIGFFFISYVYAMDNEQYYVRFTQKGNDEAGTIVTFTQTLLPLMHLFKNIKEDLPDAGTIEYPFPVPTYNMTPEEFQNIVNLFEYCKEEIERGASIVSVKTMIWNMLRNKDNRYTLLANLIKTGDYLGIDRRVAIALKRCISTIRKELVIKKNEVEETLDMALKAGLKDINKLNLPSLVPIKEGMVKDIRTHIEDMILRKTNNPITQHQKMIKKIPIPVNMLGFTPDYVGFINKYMWSVIRVGNNRGKTAWVYDFSKDKLYPFIERARTQQLKFMSQIPNQQFMPEKFNKLGLDITKIRAPSFADTIRWFKDASGIKTLMYGRMPEGFIRESFIVGLSYIGENLVIPDGILSAAPYIGRDGLKKHVAVLVNGDSYNRIIIINDTLSEAKIFKTLEDENFLRITSICVVGSELVLSGTGKKNESKLIMIDLNDAHVEAKNIETRSFKKVFTNKLIAYYDNEGYLTVVGKDNREPNILYIYIGDLKNGFEDEIIKKEKYPIMIESCPQLISGICIANLAHPDVKGLAFRDIVEIDNIWYVAGCDFTTNSIVYCE